MWVGSRSSCTSSVKKSRSFNAPTRLHTCRHVEKFHFTIFTSADLSDLTSNSWTCQLYLTNWFLRRNPNAIWLVTALLQGSLHFVRHFFHQTHSPQKLRKGRQHPVLALPLSPSHLMTAGEEYSTGAGGSEAVLRLSATRYCCWRTVDQPHSV